ncbi:hypothetical protein QTH91_22075 [Variovorax dokdonensis]|uniref:Uncharacterized protein n=1 Tax=Variovorax dokdonensis TaxID=344883 RepID=A0ABT7NGZ0_9BURK|nr:hypothetical protein [Variovorax dokdonensis]MDM0047196.1 hypothetical protein [Variovorax dokdonensis]
MTTIATTLTTAAQGNPAAHRHSWLRELIAAMPIVILVKAMRSARR